MVHKIIGTNIFIQTSQAGINLFNAQEKDIQEYSEILKAFSIFFPTFALNQI